jgi:hypothetical protein
VQGIAAAVVRFGRLGVDHKGGVVARQRLVEPAQCAQGVAVVDGRFDISRTQRHRRVEIGQGLVAASQFDQDVAAVIEGLRVLRIEGDRMRAGASAIARS